VRVRQPPRSVQIPCHRRLLDMGDLMCDHTYEIESEVLEVTFDEYDVAEIVARKCWRCYDCSTVVDVELEDVSDVLAANP